jgi:hypothetical protein
MLVAQALLSACFSDYVAPAMYRRDLLNTLREQGVSWLNTSSTQDDFKPVIDHRPHCRPVEYQGACGR